MVKYICSQFLTKLIEMGDEIMSIIVRLKRLINKRKGVFQVWDTSAIITWLDRLKTELDNGTNVIVPEGVVHELSVKRRSHERFKNAYTFVKECVVKNMKVHVTSDKMRPWAIDEQVVAITYNEYYKKGYEVKLVTCDHDQAYKARLRGMEVELLAGNRSIQKANPDETAPVIEEVKPEEEMAVPCVMRGKEHYINVKSKLSVYNAKGKRKIGKNDWLLVDSTDVLACGEYKYLIRAMTENSLLLKKMSL